MGVVRKLRSGNIINSGDRKCVRNHYFLKRHKLRGLYGTTVAGGIGRDRLSRADLRERRVPFVRGRLPRVCARAWPDEEGVRTQWFLTPFSPPLTPFSVAKENGGTENE